jgi:hypothetical protein
VVVVGIDGVSVLVGVSSAGCSSGMVGVGLRRYAAFLITFASCCIVVISLVVSVHSGPMVDGLSVARRMSWAACVIHSVTGVCVLVMVLGIHVIVSAMRSRDVSMAHTR